MPNCWMISYVGFSACFNCKVSGGLSKNGQMGFFTSLDRECDCFLWEVIEFLDKSDEFQYLDLNINDYCNTTPFKDLDTVFHKITKHKLKKFLAEEYYNGAKVLDD